MSMPKTDDELKTICQEIARKVNTQADFNAQLTALGINRTAAITWHPSGRMYMGMIFGISGKTLSF